MIIGLTGKNAAGKGEVAKYLQKKGFAYYSLSDIIREEATKRGLEHTRDNLIILGNELRNKFGPSYLAQQINNIILKKINENKSNENKNQNFVVDSIRSPFEAKELMKNKDFILVGVDAPIELRLKRMQKRGRLGDAKTVEQLNQQEERENLNNAVNQQLDETFKLAQKVIVNGSALKQLHKKVDFLLEEIMEEVI